MSLLSERQIPADFGDQLRNAGYVTAEFFSDIIRATSRRLPAANQNARVARVARLPGASGPHGHALERQAHLRRDETRRTVLGSRSKRPVQR